MSVGQSFENIAKVAEGFDVIQLGRCQQRNDDGPAFGAAIGACEQMVLSAERDRPDGAFDGIVIKLDAAILQEAAERGPTAKCINEITPDIRRDVKVGRANST